jgi:hypothetical protein
MKTATLQEMRVAIYQRHNCEVADCVGSNNVIVRNGGTETVFDVRLFDIRKHPKATQCYAWAEFIDAKLTVFPTVLRTSAISSAEQAIRAYYGKQKPA